MCAKHYENPIMLSRVTAKNVGDVFLRHTVVAFHCSNKQKRQNYGVQNNYIDSNAKTKGGQN